jgi:hypothetical protein
MEALFSEGRIHRSSAVAAGFPDSPARKSWAVAEPKPRRVVVLDDAGLVWVR